MSILKSSITAIVILIVFALLWATGLYLMILSKKAHVKYDNEKVFFHAPTDASLQKKIKNKELPTRITDEIYSLGFWMYVESWDNKKNQHIISKGVGLCHQPSIYLSKDDNKLLIKLTKNSLHDTDVCLHEDIEIPDIPIKRWVHFYMNVERSVVNIYINSFLVTSHILKVPIKQNDDNIVVNNTNGFDGLLSKLVISNYVKENKDIKTLYNKGPYGYSITDLFKDLYNKNKSRLSNLFDFCNR